MSEYPEIPTDDIRTTRGVYRLVNEALDEALAFDDANLREAIETARAEFQSYIYDLENELRERGVTAF